VTDLLGPGEVAPDFELTDIQGQRVRLSELRGHPVVLAFLRGFL
jgi:peroxiredoxin